MKPRPTRDRKQNERSVELRSANRAVSPDGDPMEASAGRILGDEAEGQLGPDELPDPAEVVMNQEAKRHH